MLTTKEFPFSKAFPKQRPFIILTSAEQTVRAIFFASENIRVRIRDVSGRRACND